jgi:type IV pilus assembly protein PilY1
MNTNLKPVSRIKKLVQTALAILLSAGITLSEAAILSLENTPLYLINAVEPNVLLTFDDSGSMGWGYMPDCVRGGGTAADCPAPYSGTTSLENTKRGCAPLLNYVSYNPAVTYDPPVNANNQPLFTGTNATTFTRAYVNGFNPSGQWLDLSSNTAAGSETSTTSGTGYRYKWDMTATGNAYDNAANCGTGNSTGRSAYYVIYDSTIGGCPAIPANANLALYPSTTNEACYTIVTVSATSGPGGTDERQNFANWYSYYSTRNLMAKTSAGRALARLGNNIRIAGHHLNNGTAGTGAGIMFTNTVPVMRRFCDDSGGTDPYCPDGTARTDFFTRLYNSQANGTTPLRQALMRAGDSFGVTNTGANSPYRDVPGDGASPERSCRQNMHILLTDGYWNGSGGTFVTANEDGVAQTFPDGTAYTTTHYPYSDTVVAGTGTTGTAAGTLADGAFNYWRRDLRNDLVNNVGTRYSVTTGTATQNYWNPVNDPANWQHLVNFTIGLGIPGVLNSTDTATYNNLLAGTQGWPRPADGDIRGANIDDLWHAALNSRGQYFSARDNVSLINAFTSIINAVTARDSAASSVSMNAGTLTTNSFIYQSRFNTVSWSGQLLAYAIDPATGQVGAQQWDAAQNLVGQHYDTGREILTFKPSTGTGAPFRWASLDPAQQTLLNYNTVTAATDALGAARLNWVRGDASNEGASFRTRTRMCGVTQCPAGTNTGWLGDIIDSAPVYVGVPPHNYPDTLEAQPYSAYKNSKSNRTPVIYVGANDGMLHAFNATNGNEIMAYVPGAVYSNLSALTAPVYAHKYFVNGNHNAIDAFVGSQWRTILAGSLRKGGQGIYALDVSTPELLTEGNASTRVLWEFNDTHDADLGYSYSEPVIARMQNGKWAVIFGNGYNNTDASVPPFSSTGNAVLYILFIEDGMDGNWAVSDFVKIDTGVGNDANNLPNGLASPAAVDIDGDRIVDLIYAGDLRGNMWRFDVRSSNSANWTSPANRMQLFVSGSNKPITTRPIVGPQPASGTGAMVYFGTGKYLETADASVAGATTQTFYGIWDNLTGGTVTTGNLVAQSISTSGSYRTVTDNPVDWSLRRGWYMDLPTGGERVVANPTLYGGVLIYTTIIPSNDVCVAGGSGWLMEVNAANGGQLPSSVFDTNGDGVINNLDTIGGLPPQGKLFPDGFPSMPTILSGGNPAVGGGAACGGQDIVYINKSDGSIEMVCEAKPLGSTADTFAPRSWRQVR